MRARALHHLARFARDQGDQSLARERFAAALRLGRELGATAVVVWALRDLAQMLSNEGEYAQARALLEEGLTLSRALSDRRQVGVTLIYLARTALYDDEVE